MATDTADFAQPADLDADGVKVWAIIEAWRTIHGYHYTGGCPLYRSPAAWKARGEQYGCNSVLVLVHDGGDFSAYNDDNGSVLMKEDLRKMLAKAGFFIEPCTGWYDAVYKLRAS